MPQVVEVGNGLAHGKEPLLQVEFAPEQDGKHVRGADRSWGGTDRDFKFRQAIDVMCLQLGYAQRHAAKRQSMRRQDQRFRRQR